MTIKGFDVEVGWGKWDSWGFGISYCHYDHAFSIDFIHWYIYASFNPRNDS